jgi:predicted Zn-dependent protease
MRCFCHPDGEHAFTAQRVLDRRAVAFGVATGAIGLVGCATNPTTGRSQLILVGDAQLQALSVDAWNQMRQKEPLSGDARLNERVRSVGARVAQTTGIENANWEYAVFAKDQVNAFVLPGGKVGVFKGLLDLTGDDDNMLATVIGHEAAHVSARHAAERVSRELLAQAAVQVGASQITRLPIDPQAARALGGALGLGVQYGVLMPFSREQELEADRVGLRYMSKAGYDPRGAVYLWQRMASRPGARPPEWLSTHPAERTRIEALTAEVRAMGYQV